MTEGAPRLVVFARAPVIGGAKSRLSQDIGTVPAWRAHRAMAARVLARARDPRWETIVSVTPDGARAQTFPGVWPARVERVAQGGGDLGDRIVRALARRGATVVIGTDAPDIAARDIAAALAALRRADMVYGPARDGGFWLIGAKRPLEQGALDGVRWSGPHALADTRAALGGREAFLRELADVDTGADWRARGGL